MVSWERLHVPNYVRAFVAWLHVLPTLRPEDIESWAGAEQISITDFPQEIQEFVSQLLESVRASLAL